MISLTKKIELLANIAIIVVAILLSIVLSKNYLLHNPAQTDTGSRIMPQRQVTKGKKLTYLVLIGQRMNKRSYLLFRLHVAFARRALLSINDWRRHGETPD